MLQNGAVYSFRDEGQLDRIIGELVNLGYEIAQTRGDSDLRALHPLLTQVTMRYGGWSVSSLDALVDTLRYIDFTSVTGWALVLRHFGETFHSDPSWAREVY